MPWLPNGDYYIFDEDSIKAKAPPISGVYGLYNIRNQIFIGESADIREALLQHAREAALAMGKCRPTGFTFEACPATIRTERAQQLISEYRPVLQTRSIFGLSRPWVTRKKRAATPFHSYSAVSLAASSPGNGEHSAAAGEKIKTPVKSFYFSRKQMLTLGLAFTVTAVLIAALGILTGIKLEQTRSMKPERSAAARTVVYPLMDFEAPEPSKTEELPSETPGATASLSLHQPADESQKPEDTIRQGAIKPKLPVQATVASLPQNGRNQPSERSDKPVKQEEFTEIIKPDGKNLWSVQVRSSAEKSHAAKWVETLNAKGYGAFWVEADVKGTTWYRVRVGQFKNRHEAETLRQTLDVKEGFHDAFLTRDRAPGTLLTKKGQ